MRRIAITLSVLLEVFVLSRFPALAAEETGAAGLLTGGLNAANDAGPGFQQISVAALVGRMIQILLGLTGIIFLGILIWAGIMYMTAAGDPGKVDKAKKMMTQSVIGIVIIVSAYSISTFIIGQLQGAISTP